MNKIALLSVLLSFAAAFPAQALSVKEMQNQGSAIKWRESDSKLRATDIEEYIMNVKVPSGNIDIAAIEACAQKLLEPYHDVQVMDENGPSFHNLMDKCII